MHPYYRQHCDGFLLNVLPRRLPRLHYHFTRGPHIAGSRIHLVHKSQERISIDLETSLGIAKKPYNGCSDYTLWTSGSVTKQGAANLQDYGNPQDRRDLRNTVHWGERTEPILYKQVAQTLLNNPIACSSIAGIFGVCLRQHSCVGREWRDHKL